MISFFDFLQDLANPLFPFLPKALLISVIAALVCAVVGTHVVLRGMAFIGDAVSHAIFPGLAIAFVMQTSLLAGGAVAGLIIAVLITLFSYNRRIKEDAIIGVFFAAAFALGLVIIARQPGYTGSLQSFLFGSLTGIPDSDVVLAAIVAGIIITITMLFHRQLLAVGLDRETARAMNLPVLWLDLLLTIMVTAAVVISVRTIGNVLVLALLVTPAATARMVTERFAPMIAIAAAIGAVGAFFGIYLSWALDVPTGAAIVLVVSTVFIVVWLFAPRHGTLTKPIALWVARKSTTKNGSTSATKSPAVGTPITKNESEALA